MDAEQYQRFQALTAAIGKRVGFDSIRSLKIGNGYGDIHLMPSAFEMVAGQRPITQELTGKYNERSFSVSGFKVLALYAIPKLPTVPMPGEYIDLCDERPPIAEAVVLCDESHSDDDTVLYADADKAVLEKSMGGAA